MLKYRFTLSKQLKAKVFTSVQVISFEYRDKDADIYSIDLQINRIKQNPERRLKPGAFLTFSQLAIHGVKWI